MVQFPGALCYGLAPGERVAIVGENSLQWCAPIWRPSRWAAQCHRLADLSDVMLSDPRPFPLSCGLVQNPTGVGRLLNLKSQLPALSHIVVMEGAASHLPDTVSFAQLVERGARVEEVRLFEILESVHGNDLATIMYTSGSTGEPKGVMRTQDNLLSNISNGGAIVRAAPEELFIIVLSLNHLFGRFGFLKSAVTGRTTAIIEATELELNVKLLERLAGTSLAVVPRVMERIWQSLLEEDGNGELWERLETLDRKKTERAKLDDDQSRQFDELRATLKNIVQKSLGGRIKYMSYAGAAMPPRIMRFFELIGIPLIGSYGSTECGGVTLSGIGDTKPGSLGKPFPNCELQIAEDGELLVRGPTVTPGYFENPEATREAIDPEGWFHTGDLGTIDADGCLFISGRKKDIFNCSDGSNIYPGYIELLLENEPSCGRRSSSATGAFHRGVDRAGQKKIAGELHKENAALTEER